MRASCACGEPQPARLRPRFLVAEAVAKSATTRRRTFSCPPTGLVLLPRNRVNRALSSLASTLDSSTTRPLGRTGSRSCTGSGYRAKQQSSFALSAYAAGCPGGSCQLIATISAAAELRTSQTA
jgi:hypothetical protein